ncbi:hypothetical protein [Microcoleus sp. B3-D7]|uniref:hypothetical protein n=1 Tax=Microcoleus sp. B3-D7 TaxID=2818659 RepID=UPI002FD24774
MGKQLTPAQHVLTLLHITQTGFRYGWQHWRAFLPRSRRAEFARLAHHVVATAFSVSRNSFVRFSSLQINLIVWD